MNGEDDGFSSVIDLQKYGLRTPHLRDYDLQIVDGGLLMIWHSPYGSLRDDGEEQDGSRVGRVQSGGVVLKHHLHLWDRRFRFHPKRHPYVMKGDVARKRRSRLEVRFHEPQKVELYKAKPWDPNEPDKSQRWEKILDTTIPKLLYVFEHHTYQDRFLSDLRGKKVQRFDFEELWSERKDKDKPDKGESSQQVLYLWSHWTNRSQDTISFYANKDKGHGDVCPTYEYLVQWFESPVELSKPKNSVKLRLKSPRSGSDIDPDTRPPKRRSFSLKRVASIFHSENASPVLERPTPAPLPTPPASGTVSGNGSQKSPASPMERNSPEEHIQSEISQKFGSLAIQFASYDGEPAQR